MYIYLRTYAVNLCKRIVLARQRPLPDVVVAPALVPCPSESALACRHCRAGSRPLPISVHPRLPSSLRRLSSLVHPRLPLSWRRLSSLARQRPSSPAVIVAPTLVPCPTASALACRRRHAGSRPLPVGVCPRLPSSLRQLLSLVRPRLPSPLCRLSSLARQRPPSPAVVVAPALVPCPPSPAVVVASALVPCPSASALACRRCRRRRRHRPRTRRPAATLTIPSTSVVQRRHNHYCHQAVFAAAANRVLFGRSTF